MFTTSSEYDRGVNTYSPEGRLFQVEYALGAIKLGTTAVVITVQDGVILASEKRVGSVLLESMGTEKILPISDNIACAMSGLVADARILIDHARVFSEQHRFMYNEPATVRACAEAVADMALDFSETRESRKRTMSRPFGVALLFAGVNNGKTELWCTDPSGTCTRYNAAAIGSAQEGAENILQEQYDYNKSMNDATILAIQTLRHVMEDKLNEKNIEIVQITIKDAIFKRLTQEEIGLIINNLPSPLYPSRNDIVASVMDENNN